MSQNNKIIFIYPVMGQDITMSHGVCSLSGELKRRGYDTRLIYLYDMNFEKPIAEICEEKPLFVGMSMTYNHWKMSCQFAASLKKCIDVPIFSGGPHSILFPESINDEKAVDGICIGEGEIPIAQLADRIRDGEDFYDVEGMWFNTPQGVRRNKPARVVENLDDLPMPDFDLFPRDAILNYPAFIFSRGCPFKCTYCCNHKYQKLLKYDNFVRFKSVEKCIHEIKTFLDRFYTAHIIFDDDIFIQNVPWRTKFLEAYKNEIDGTTFACNTRPELIREEVCEKLKAAGCSTLKIGLESGDEHMRQTILKRPMKNELIVKGCENAKKYGLRVMTFNLVGVPGETPEIHEQTVKLNKTIQPDDFQISIFYPYPGTELGDHCFEKKLVKETESMGFLDRSVLRLKDFKAKDIKMYREIFRFRVLYEYNGHRAVESIDSPSVIASFIRFYKEEFPELVLEAFRYIVLKKYQKAMNLFFDMSADCFVDYPLTLLLAERLVQETNVSFTEQFYKIASDLKRQKEFDAARKVFATIHQIYKNNLARFGGGALYHIGETYRLEENYEQAIQYYKETNQINVAHVKAKERIVDIQKKTNSHEKDSYHKERTRLAV